MNRKLALLPVDNRPVTGELPRQLATLANWEVLTPPTEDLGFLKHPASIPTITNWLKTNAPHVDGFILSADMLAYGGLVPSRISEDPYETILQRLQIIADLNNTYPEKSIHVFSATMRISNNNVNEEEKEYWKNYGKDIWAYSYHTHRYHRHKQQHDLDQATVLKQKIPPSILADYVKTRQRNFQINQKLLEFARRGIINLLIFPQDDTADYGLNIKEQEELRQQIQAMHLNERVYIYPGADEVASVLTARSIFDLEGENPPLFYPVYSGERGAHIAARYEDRPISESVSGQIFAMGSGLATHPSRAHVILGVNVPGSRQGDWALEVDLEQVDTDGRDIGEWIRRLNKYRQEGKKVAIADLAYANGADPAMVEQLLETLNIGDLAGFAAWNTAGNTLGTVVAQAALSFLGEKKGESVMFSRNLEQQLVHRFLDDYVYQSVVRQEVRKIVGEGEVRYEKLLPIVRESFWNKAETFMEKHSVVYPIKDIDLPWKRTFEIKITFKK
ncbi:DUF4127 family protein [Evansella tamaricis]|uniref:DUF4127 family protein n=1 Tax=Evansella tamaricis TaxID=2069301 RepID=A0ABS6J9U2_9BACI|nr:DUF4127 family protein [Evansella tamaricis]MBU9710220.1 DUF4127 family protein [Evansella tamaricis]